MPVSPAQISEDNLISPMRVVNGCMVEIEGVYEKNGEVYPRPWQVSRLEDDEGERGKDCRVGNVGFSSGSADMGSMGEVEVEGSPHEALNYVLSYLGVGVKDLLSVERVCSSLSSAVRSDPLLWKTIHIDEPLSNRITDDALVQLAGRAQGNLQCLSLLECRRITDEGLSRVLVANRRLTKLCVPGCWISMNWVVNCVRAYNSNNEFGGIKQLRVAHVLCLRSLGRRNHIHFEELKSLLGSSDEKIESGRKLNFYQSWNVYLPLDDDRAIDIETCPRCERPRLIFDCPSEHCKVNNASGRACRACFACIERCGLCGRCSNNVNFIDSYKREIVCCDCFINYNVRSLCDLRPEGMLRLFQAKHGRPAI